MEVFNLRHWLLPAPAAFLACSPLPPPSTAPEIFEERTVVLTDPPGARIVVDAETLTAVAPLILRYRRERLQGATTPVRIRVLPVLPGQCPQGRLIHRNEPAPDTLRFQLHPCPQTDQDFTRIFDVEEVDSLPERLRGPLPDPEYLLQSGKDGLVRLRVVIDASGRPERGSVDIVEATDPGFIPSARRTVLGSVFRPGRLLGRNVRTRVVIPINYTIRR